MPRGHRPAESSGVSAAACGGPATAREGQSQPPTPRPGSPTSPVPTTVGTPQRACCPHSLCSATPATPTANLPLCPPGDLRTQPVGETQTGRRPSVHGPWGAGPPRSHTLAHAPHGGPGHRTPNGTPPPSPGGVAPTREPGYRQPRGSKDGAPDDVSSSTQAKARGRPLTQAWRKHAPLPAQRPADLEPSTCLASAAAAETQLRRKQLGPQSGSSGYAADQNLHSPEHRRTQGTLPTPGASPGPAGNWPACLSSRRLT